MFSPPDYSAGKNFLNPKFGPWTVVLYLHRKRILRSVLKTIPFLKGRLLDVGCGSKPYKTLLKCEEYIGVDVATSPHESAVFDVVFDGRYLPFADESFDSILCTEVLEHCLDPNILMQEISRVLKPGGCAFITAPMFIEHHEVPYDMRRQTYYGMARLASDNKLTIEWIDDRGNVFSVLIASVYIALGQLISRRPFSDIIYWICFPFTCVLLTLDTFRKKNPAVISLGWQMLAKKKNDGFK
ncbi:MAG: class I SAM-dependent methyltransferase [Chitinophagaceae bacterium]|nr:class I SAM-dependent methyltransferase [Chitinophagaceae bacterium]